MSMQTKCGQTACYVAVLLVGSLTGCSAQTKTLNESSAKRLLIDHLKSIGETFLLPLADVNQQLHATREDYLSGSYGEADPKALVQRLLKAGYVHQTREDIKYNNVSGTYKGETPGCGSGGFEIKTRIQTFTLSMKPGDPAVDGQYTYDSWYALNGHKSLGWSGPVKGQVNPDGTVELIYGPMYTHVKYTFQSDGANIALTGRTMFECGTGQMTLTGTGPGGFISVPKFSYSYTDSMKKLLDGSGKLKAGTSKIDEVHNLLLETDAIATARFTWHVDLNEPGAAVIGKPRVSGTDAVTFRKQPDGTWVLPSN